MVDTSGRALADGGSDGDSRAPCAQADSKTDRVTMTGRFFKEWSSLVAQISIEFRFYAQPECRVLHGTLSSSKIGFCKPGY
jgi:hypothetical protein